MILIMRVFNVRIGSGEVPSTEIIEEELSENNLEISPYTNYISRASCFLYVDSNGRETTDYSIYGYKRITIKVSIEATLQKYKGGRWVNIKTFKQNSDSHRVPLVCLKDIPIEF